MRGPVVALEAHLKKCRSVLTLGVRPNFNDYSAHEKALIRTAPKIYYPSTFYADLLDAAGKCTFPSYHTYKCVQDKIRQTALFELLELPHPRTRVFYGKVAPTDVYKDFSLPCIGKIPRGSARGRGTFLLSTPADLQAYLASVRPAYIQEYLPAERDIRVVVIAGEAVLSYWRCAPCGDFRTNLALGGEILLETVPDAAVQLALTAARRCRWDDVGIDILCGESGYVLLEANMKYGRTGFRAAGIDYFAMMEALIARGRI